MKTTILGTIIALLLCGGCQQDSGKHAVQPENQPQFSVDLPMAHVDILSRNDDMQNGKSVRMSLRVTYPDGAVRERTLNLASSREGDDAGYAATLLDQSGNLVVRATQRWGMSADSSVRYFLSEATQTDQLELRAVTKGSRVQESYTLNGKSCEASYDRSTPSEQQAGSRFAKFYGRSGTPPKLTIDNNVDGSMMMQLLSNREYARWLFSAVAPMPKVECDIVCKVCATATLCSYLKCTFGGGPLNFVCDSCVGVDIACAIASFFL